LAFAVLLAASAAATPARAAQPAPGESSAVAVRQTDGKIVTIAESPPCRTAASQCASGFAVSRFDADGTPDPSFEFDGTAVTSFGRGVAATPRSVAIDAQGRIIVAGTLSSAKPSDFVVARYLPDGALDPAFGTGGAVITDLATESQDIASGIALTPAGEPLVYGLVYAGGEAELGVARYSEDGALDEGFGREGVALIRLPGLLSPGPISVQPDGKAILAAVTGSGSSLRLVVARIEAGGTIDRSFGQGGSTVVDEVANFSFGGLEARSVEVDGEGGIVAGATERIGEHCCFNAALAGLTPNGDLDTGFGSPSGVARVRRTLLGAVAALSGGELLIATVSHWGLAPVKLGPEGAVRPTYNRGGQGILWVAGHTTWAEAVFPEADGSALVLARVTGGRCPSPGRPRGRACTALALVRYLPSGKLDRRFGKGGVVTRPPILRCTRSLNRGRRRGVCDTRARSDRRGRAR
jgi:uncharacterized delta-60 repeat protein